MDSLIENYKKVLLKDLDIPINKKSITEDYIVPNEEFIKKNYTNSATGEFIKENHNISTNKKTLIEDCKKSLPEVQILPLIQQNQEDNCSENIYKSNIGKSYIKDEKEKSTKNKYSKANSKIHKSYMDDIANDQCKASVISETLALCENVPHTSDVTKEPVTVKIPVVLTECKVTITIESFLKLEDDISEIKHIRKNVYLNQCKLIPRSEDHEPNTGILFIDGFVRKNIEYITEEYTRKGVSNGKVKHSTVKVPFKCTTRVKFKTQPKFTPTTPQDEVELLETNIRVCDPCEEGIVGRDICEQSFKFTEFFNEKVFCELISAEIVESDILENPTKKECKLPIEQTFHNITEKVVLFLTIKLLQNQHVEIP